MSELLMVDRGYTLNGHDPLTLLHSYVDTKSQVVKPYKSPIRIEAWRGVCGYFADNGPDNNWRETHTFAYPGQSYNPGGSERYPDQAIFWSFADNAWHVIALRELSRDPSNPRLRTFDVQDSYAGQLVSPFVVDIGTTFTYNFPRLSYGVDYVYMSGTGSGGTKFFYVANEVTVTAWYGVFDSTGTVIDHTAYETPYIFSGIEASVYPYEYNQNNESHVVTETITIDS